MRARPCLKLSEAPSYSTPFYADPWPVASGSPASESSSLDYCGHSSSTSSSRTSSTCSHVLPESAFLSHAGDGGGYLVDPYFGYKDVAVLCATYLMKAFNSVEETESSRRLGQPKLSVFIAQLMHITGVPLKVVVADLILLQRFRSTLPPSNVSYSGHRLFIGALMLACSDENLHNMVPNAQSAAYWSEISLFCENELDDVFNSLYDELDGNVVVFPSYAAALEKLNNPVSIKSFEGDLQDFISSDSDSELSESSISILEGAESLQQEKKRISASCTRKSPESFSVRTRIASLFGRKTKS